ncbi:transmembrane protein, putative (macronuclear) [Tetrahymena thermophila SB210]|uniref:Transmembrane protein, putative n=1 Tax=Tetrahymena thermophila (strain SB210) TaxID=312017 RepID=W7XAR4_TETTS|nr:transmembrane protein, putative [Tetrahymena thermophila SB210]EWS76455.1 transmembrane protein, putative [Tetrahymena thermophila SB210]|eukprot:XP_012651010.1 transmembrane protein, putative [Tetrahymena thermophila SB210]
MIDQGQKPMIDQNHFQNQINTFNQIEDSEDSQYANSVAFDKTNCPQIANNLQAKHFDRVMANLQINHNQEDSYNEKLSISHNPDMLDQDLTQNNLVSFYLNKNKKNQSIILSQEQLNQQQNQDTFRVDQSQEKIKSLGNLEQHIDKYIDKKQSTNKENDQKIDQDETQGSSKINGICSPNFTPLNSPTLCNEKSLLSQSMQNGLFSPLNMKGDIESFIVSQNQDQIIMNSEKQRNSFKFNGKRASFFKKNQYDNNNDDNQKSFQNLNVKPLDQIQENGQKNHKKHTRQQEFVLRRLISNKNNFDQNELDAQRSQSCYSAVSSFRSISNVLIQNIIGKTNTIFSVAMQIFSVIYITFFALMSLIIGIIILLNLQSFSDDVKKVQEQSGFLPLIANQTLNSFSRFQMENFIIQDDPQQTLYSSLIESCEAVKQLFLQEFNDRFQTTTSTYLNNQDTYYKTVTYLNNQQTFETIDFIDMQFKVLQSSQAICGSVGKQKLLILVLIGRMSLLEADIEIEKLRVFQDALQDINQKWMNFDFVENMLFSQNKNEEEESNQQQQYQQNKQKTSKNKQTHIQNTLNLRQSQRKIISLVKNTSFNYIRGMIIIGFICLSGCVMIIANTFETADQFSFALFMSDYLSISPILNQNDPHFPQATQQIYGNPDMYQQFSQYLTNSKQFFYNILNEIDQQKQISQTYKSQIINLLQQDVCNSVGYKYDRMCIQNASPTIRQILRQGGIALFTDIFQLFSSNDSLFKFKQGDLFDIAKQNHVNQYVHSSYHLEYITHGFDIAANCFELLKQYMKEGFQDYIASFIKIGYIYLACLCLPFIVFWIILSIKIQKRVKQSIVNISFGLTLIPYEKLQEENTIIFLKKIEKY